MSSTALYKAFIEVGASEVSATRAAEDVIQVSQLPQLATKADITTLRSDVSVDIANLESKIEVLRSDVSADIANLDSKIEILRSDMAAHIANLEIRLLKWMVGCGFLFAGIVIAGVSLVV